MAKAENCFEVEPMSKTVEGAMEAPSSRFAMP
jgi:hypothetical protein